VGRGGEGNVKGKNGGGGIKKGQSERVRRGIGRGVMAERRGREPSAPLSSMDACEIGALDIAT